MKSELECLDIIENLKFNGLYDSNTQVEFICDELDDRLKLIALTEEQNFKLREQLAAAEAKIASQHLLIVALEEDLADREGA